MRTKLSDIAQVIMGQSPKSEFYNSSMDGLPFLQGRTTFGEIYPTFDTWTTVWNKEAIPGDVLFTVRAPVGDVNIAQQRIALGRGVAAIRPITTSTRYLFYLLYANKSLFTSASAGTIFESINKDAIDAIELEVHTLEDQRHIVDAIASLLRESS